MGHGAEGEGDAVLDRAAALSMTSRTLEGGGLTLGQYYAPPPLPPWLLQAFGTTPDSTTLLVLSELV